jgi:hypothetical protein
MSSMPGGEAEITGSAAASDRTAGPGGRIRGGLRWVTTFAAASLVVLAACQGDNLFSTDPEGGTARVEIAVNPAVALGGDTIRIRVEAAHPAGLRRIGYAALNALGDTIGGGAVLVPTSGTARDTVFAFVVPAGVSAAGLTLHGIVVDSRGRRSVSAATSVRIADATPPRVTILEPTRLATFPLGDSIRVQVRVQDVGGVVEVRMGGFAVRGDTLQDTRIVERFQQRTVSFPQAPSTRAPTDTTIMRFVLPLPSDVTETVHLVVSAKDAAGNTGADTIHIAVGGPRVEIRSPLPGSEAVAGQTMTLRVFAVDRTAGVDSIRVIVAGARNDTIRRGRLGSADSVTVELPLPAGNQTGELTISATAWNRAQVAGRTAVPLRVTVVATAAADTARPRVGLTVNAPARVETTDSIRVQVVATDVGSAGLARLGIVAVVIPDTTSIRQDTIYRSITFPTVQTGTIQQQFAFTLKELYGERPAIAMPRRFSLQVHAFAVDAAGNCGASVQTAQNVVECEPISANGVQYSAARAQTGQAHGVTAVSGYSRALPAGSRIADIAIDAQRQQFYMSNIALNRLDVLDLRDSVTFRTVAVGSQPWGMFVAGNGSELIVANSGGTNLSVVDMAALQELPARRILTPNAVLINVTLTVTQAGAQYVAEELDFSDRPQFVAQDARGTILYSTVPTGAAPNGTVRYRDPASGEVRILFTGAAVDRNAEGIALAHIDSVLVERNLGSQDRIRLFDRVPGTGTPIPTTFHVNIRDAVTELRDGGSDIAEFPGAWIRDQVGLSDTTFLAASGDRAKVAFGEGASAPHGRVMIWDAATRQLSAQQAVVDLLGNASERVFGLALDTNGAIGAARGLDGAYFFSNGIRDAGELRLQGIFNAPSGAGSVALHPEHAYTDRSTPATLSFVPTPDRTVRVVDTFHYCQVGVVTIKDNMVGQIRAVQPWQGENAGRAMTDPNFLITRLFGVTDTGRAVIVDVRRKDLHRGWQHAPLPPASVSVCPL